MTTVVMEEEKRYQRHMADDRSMVVVMVMIFNSNQIVIMSDTVLKELYMQCHLILTIFLWSSFNFYLHFTNEKADSEL